MIKPIALFFLIVALAACSSKPVYDEEVNIPRESWHKDSAIVFKPFIEKAKKPFNLEFTVENSNDYPYQNLWLRYRVISPSNHTFTDSVNIFLTNSSGKWIGSYSGGVHSRHVVARKGIGFTEKGEYQFQIIHWMRKKRLKGIKEVGLIVRPAPEKKPSG